MVAVHMGDENTTNLTGLKLATQKLVLGAFAAVKQPYFPPLG
jgi:hypothetical protein